MFIRLSTLSPVWRQLRADDWLQVRDIRYVVSQRSLVLTQRWEIPYTVSTVLDVRKA